MTTRFTSFVQHEDVVEVVGIEGAARGRACFEGGHVFNARQRRSTEQDGIEFWGQCTAEHVRPYFVHVWLNQRQVIGWRCSCSSASACEHVAALLYAWIYDPEVFEVVEGWRDVMTGWSKERLLAVIFSLGDHSADNDELLQAEIEDGYQVLFAKTQDSVEAIGRAPLWRVPELANELVADGYAEQAGTLVIKRIGNERSGILVDWLIEHYEQISDYPGALTWARRRLDEVPRAAYYATVWSIAQRLGVWVELRPVLLMRLKRACFPEYIKALLLEGRLVESLDEYDEGVRQGEKIPDATRLRLAEIAELIESERAVAIYFALVDGLIERRTREYYRIAAYILARVELLYTRLGRKSEWQLIFSEFITLYPRRPVLFEELERADLLEID